MLKFFNMFFEEKVEQKLWKAIDKCAEGMTKEGEEKILKLVSQLKEEKEAQQIILTANVQGRNMLMQACWLGSSLKLIALLISKLGTRAQKALASVDDEGNDAAKLFLSCKSESVAMQGTAGNRFGVFHLLVLAMGDQKKSIVAQFNKKNLNILMIALNSKVVWESKDSLEIKFFEQLVLTAFDRNNDGDNAFTWAIKQKNALEMLDILFQASLEKEYQNSIANHIASCLLVAHGFYKNSAPKTKTFIEIFKIHSLDMQFTKIREPESNLHMKKNIETFCALLKR